eukprot:m51a1_g4852 hypothetical protein (1309) ;mRNA; r:268459-278657
MFSNANGSTRPQPLRSVDVALAAITWTAAAALTLFSAIVAAPRRAHEQRGYKNRVAGSAPEVDQPLHEHAAAMPAVYGGSRRPGGKDQQIHCENDKNKRDNVDYLSLGGLFDQADCDTEQIHNANYSVDYPGLCDLFDQVDCNDGQIHDANDSVDYPGLRDLFDQDDCYTEQIHNANNSVDYPGLRDLFCQVDCNDGQIHNANDSGKRYAKDAEDGTNYCDLSDEQIHGENDSGEHSVDYPGLCNLFDEQIRGENDSDERDATDNGDLDVDPHSFHDEDYALLPRLYDQMDAAAVYESSHMDTPAPSEGYNSYDSTAGDSISDGTAESDTDAMRVSELETSDHVDSAIARQWFVYDDNVLPARAEAETRGADSPAIAAMTVSELGTGRDMDASCNAHYFLPHGLIDAARSGTADESRAGVETSAVLSDLRITQAASPPIDAMTMSELGTSRDMDASCNARYFLPRGLLVDTRPAPTGNAHGRNGEGSDEVDGETRAARAAIDVMTVSELGTGRDMDASCNARYFLPRGLIEAARPARTEDASALAAESGADGTRAAIDLMAVSELETSTAHYLLPGRLLDDSLVVSANGAHNSAMNSTQRQYHALLRALLGDAEARTPPSVSSGAFPHIAGLWELVGSYEVSGGTASLPDRMELAFRTPSKLSLVFPGSGFANGTAALDQAEASLSYALTSTAGSYTCSARFRRTPSSGGFMYDRARVACTSGTLRATGEFGCIDGSCARSESLPSYGAYARDSYSVHQGRSKTVVWGSDMPLHELLISTLRADSNETGLFTVQTTLYDGTPLPELSTAVPTSYFRPFVPLEGLPAPTVPEERGLVVNVTCVEVPAGENSIFAKVLTIRANRDFFYRAHGPWSRCSAGCTRTRGSSCRAAGREVEGEYCDKYAQPPRLSGRCGGGDCPRDPWGAFPEVSGQWALSYPIVSPGLMLAFELRAAAAPDRLWVIPEGHYASDYDAVLDREAAVIRFRTTDDRGTACSCTGTFVHAGEEQFLFPEMGLACRCASGNVVNATGHQQVPVPRLHGRVCTSAVVPQDQTAEVLRTSAGSAVLGLEVRGDLFTVTATTTDGTPVPGLSTRTPIAYFRPLLSPEGQPYYESAAQARAGPGVVVNVTCISEQEGRTRDCHVEVCSWTGSLATAWSWSSGSRGHCSPKCRRSNARCLFDPFNSLAEYSENSERSEATEASEALCSKYGAPALPEATSEACEWSECPLHWEYGPWSECSAKCTHYRESTCRNAAGEALPAKHCFDALHTEATLEDCPACKTTTTSGALSPILSPALVAACLSVLVSTLWQ